VSGPGAFTRRRGICQFTLIVGPTGLERNCRLHAHRKPFTHSRSSRGSNSSLPAGR
jgi:hypothetical protein